MAPPSRLLIAHDLPMEIGALEPLQMLGDGWYLPRDPFAQIDELLMDGHVQIEREGPERIVAYLHPDEGAVIVGQGATTSEALLAVYNGLRSRDV